MIKRTLWICPMCKGIQPTQHQSVIRHITRKHNSQVEPVSVDTGQTRHLMLTTGMFVRTGAPLKETLNRSTNRFSNNLAANPGLESQRSRKHPESSDQFESIAMMAQLKYMVDINEKLGKILNQNATIIEFLMEIWKGFFSGRSNNIK